MPWLLAVATGVWLSALTACDLVTQRLPNALTLPGAVAVLAVATALGSGAGAVAGAVLLSATYLLIHLVDPAGLGAGDVKLALGVGALTGAFGVTVWTSAAVGAPLLTLMWAVTTGRRAVPHGPAMCAASAVAVAAALALT